jgi:hypothetical protein
MHDLSQSSERGASFSAVGLRGRCAISSISWIPAQQLDILARSHAGAKTGSDSHGGAKTGSGSVSSRRGSAVGGNGSLAPSTADAPAGGNSGNDCKASLMSGAFAGAHGAEGTDRLFNAAPRTDKAAATTDKATVSGRTTHLAAGAAAKQYSADESAAGAEVDGDDMAARLLDGSWKMPQPRSRSPSLQPRSRSPSTTVAALLGMRRRSSAGQGEASEEAPRPSGYLLTAGADGVAKLWTASGELVGILASPTLTAAVLATTRFATETTPKPPAPLDQPQQQEYSRAGQAQAQAEHQLRPVQRRSAVEQRARLEEAIITAAFPARATPVVVVGAVLAAAEADSALSELQPAAQPAAAGPKASTAAAALNEDGRCWHVGAPADCYLRVQHEAKSLKFNPARRQVGTASLQKWREVAVLKPKLGDGEIGGSVQARWEINGNHRASGSGDGLGKAVKAVDGGPDVVERRQSTDARALKGGAEGAGEHADRPAPPRTDVPSAAGAGVSSPTGCESFSSRPIAAGGEEIGPIARQPSCAADPSSLTAPQASSDGGDEGVSNSPSSCSETTDASDESDADVSPPQLSRFTREQEACRTAGHANLINRTISEQISVILARRTNRLSFSMAGAMAESLAGAGGVALGAHANAGAQPLHVEGRAVGSVMHRLNLKDLAATHGARTHRVMSGGAPISGHGGASGARTERLRRAAIPWRAGATEHGDREPLGDSFAGTSPRVGEAAKLARLLDTELLAFTTDSARAEHRSALLPAARQATSLKSEKTVALSTGSRGGQRAALPVHTPPSPHAGPRARSGSRPVRAAAPSANRKSSIATAANPALNMVRQLDI